MAITQGSEIPNARESMIQMSTITNHTLQTSSHILRNDESKILIEVR
jgi:hypothetical protein